MNNKQMDRSANQFEDFSVVAPDSGFQTMDLATTSASDVKTRWLNYPQQKKELYLKLDEILIDALHKEFEIVPGHTIDRLDMVKFLTDVVRRNVAEYPDFEKVLSLRDTVLTGRIKRAFPEVEYKRKQIRQDHYRKAWLYVNIRRKPSSVSNCGQAESNVSTSAIAWTPPFLPGSVPSSQTSSSPSSPASPNHASSPHSYFNTLFDQDPTGGPLVVESGSTIHYHGVAQDSSTCTGEASIGTMLNTTEDPHADKTGLVLDGLSVQKWVVSNYIEDSSSFVPVQDVVKAFRQEYQYDISYKDCHQMIYSAFTSPRSRLSPMKTVRVTSLGQQYVYRGIAPRKRTVSGLNDQDSSQSCDEQPNSKLEHLKREKDEDWKRIATIAREERDQALKDRNQALAALMELEKEHAEALRTIEKLRNDNARAKLSEHESSTRTTQSDTHNRTRDLRADRSEASSLDMLLRKFGDTKQDDLGENDHDIRAHKDAIWKNIVTQTREEIAELLKRVEVVKKERNSYLERLHALEKENQELRDAVSVERSEASRRRLFDEIYGFKSNCGTENGTREALGSVLAHLKSKRKQSAPSKFSKVPKLGHLSETGENHFVEHVSQSDESHSPTNILDSAASSIELPDEQEVTLDCSTKRLTNATNLLNGLKNSEQNADCSGSKHTANLLVYTAGSGMVGFTPHPFDN